MATRALAAFITGRRLVVRNEFPALASSRSRGPQSDSGIRGLHTQAEERNANHGSVRDRVTAAQVEAALNTKNVEEVAQDLGARATATAVLPDEAVRNANADADAAWVPDQDTGVFVPAEEAAAASGNGTHGDDAHGESESVLDQTVFNREEEMEDVERPAVDMARGGAGAK